LTRAGAPIAQLPVMNWMQRSVDVSVVVPACWPPARLACRLAALRAQTLDPRCYEILVVDPGRDDALRRMVRGLAARTGLPRIRYLRSKTGEGRSGVREAGLRAAQAPVVAFADRAPLREDWLRQGLAQLLLQPGCGMVDALIWRQALERPRRVSGRRRFFDALPPRRTTRGDDAAPPPWMLPLLLALGLLSVGLALASWLQAALWCLLATLLLTVGLASRRGRAAARSLAGRLRIAPDTAGD
jgi:GT2 family glycosyltransferase